MMKIIWYFIGIRFRLSTECAMSPIRPSLFDAPPRTLPALDPAFRPLALGVRNYRRELAGHGRSEQLCIALEQNGDAITRKDVAVFPEGAGRDEDNLRYASWILNFLIWARGGWRVFLQGPPRLCAALAAEYAPGGAHAFDARLMEQAFARPFEVSLVGPSGLPEAKARPLTLGGHLKGCRIGFDLGASDYKVAAVLDGEPVFSAEIPWDPRNQPDPSYHYDRIREGLRLAASHLPRVDAIGGSSAGILVENRIRVASLFRAVPQDVFREKVETLFPRLQQEWGVPLEVINDGDVTALAGALSLDLTGILGIAMGSSEAVGFLDRTGRITGWLNELAFAPVDANPAAGTDDWSGNPGIGAACFSQQAVNRLASAASIPFPAEMGLPERLKLVQERMARGDAAARSIFDSIGVYLGYTIPWYAEFYELDHVMILGRVTSGAGGEVILARAKEVLSSEFPDLAEKVSLFLPDEKSRRVGQAVAAASLPLAEG
jgi:predicted NBD/HSP70 family sugar kinase